MVTVLGDQSFRFRFSSRGLAFVAAAASLCLGNNVVKAGDPAFDWSLNTTPTAGFTPAPFLYDGNLAAVQAYLNTAPAGTALAIRVNVIPGGPGSPLSTATLQSVLNNYKINYIFADLESGTNVSDTAALVAAAKSSSMSSAAYVGNYAFSTLAGDPTASSAGGTTNSNGSVTPGTTLANYRSSQVNMANPSLYPGGADQRSAAGTGTNGQTNMGNSFTSLHASLFILPIERLSYVGQNTGAGTPIIPYVARFNNNGNSSLITNYDSNGVQQFTSGGSVAGGLSGSATTNQMISRSDFQAMMLHYRMRGATSFHLFQGGVVGYTDAQFQSDALAGWSALDSGTHPGVPSTYGFGGGATPVSFGSTIHTQAGGVQSVEDAGIIASGITNASGYMALFISNLTGTAQTIVLPTSIANASVPTTDLLNVGPNASYLFEFSNSGGVWQTRNTLNGSLMFQDAGTNDVGVPEPTSLAVMGIGAIGLLIRPRRKAEKSRKF